MLQSINPLNHFSTPGRVPTVSPRMADYISRRVGARAAIISGDIALWLEMCKPPQLVMIEDQYKTSQMKSIERKL